MLDIIRHGHVAEIRLARPPVNALDQALMTALHEAIAAAPGDGARGIVLSGAPGMFSAGLDVPALLALDRAGMLDFCRSLFRLCAALARSPLPVAAAITGHSPAGGAVLALFCDYRVMARGPYRIGLNEVQVGLSVPEPIQAGLRRLVGGYRAERLMVAGAMLDPEQALACGLVDELAEPDQASARARQWLDGLLALPPRAMLGTRALARADLAETWADPDGLPVDDFVDGFFQPETQAVMRQLVARLRSKD